MKICMEHRVFLFLTEMKNTGKKKKKKKQKQNTGARNFARCFSNTGCADYVNNSTRARWR